MTPFAGRSNRATATARYGATEAGPEAVRAGDTSAPADGKAIRLPSPGTAAGSKPPNPSGMPRVREVPGPTDAAADEESRKGSRNPIDQSQRTISCAFRYAGEAVSRDVGARTSATRQVPRRRTSPMGSRDVGQATSTARTAFPPATRRSGRSGGRCCSPSPLRHDLDHPPSGRDVLGFSGPLKPAHIPVGGIGTFEQVRYRRIRNAEAATPPAP